MNENNLSVRDISKHLNTSHNSRIFVFDTINSTNTYAKELAQNGAEHGTIVIANHQTHGRGRLGREFFSPADTGIYMSILLRSADFAKFNPSSLTIAAGVAVCVVIEMLTNKNPKIKWVNDIFLNDKKICGILAEGGTLSGNYQNDYTIVGIGLNVSTKSEAFPGKLSEIAGSLFPENITRSHLVAEIINKFFHICSTYSQDKLIPEYKKRSLVLGKNISFVKDGKTCHGTAVDINNDGNLVVDLDTGSRITLFSGEVSLESSNFTTSN